VNKLLKDDIADVAHQGFYRSLLLRNQGCLGGVLIFSKTWVPDSSFTSAAFDTITGPGVTPVFSVLRLRPCNPKTPCRMPKLRLRFWAEVSGMFVFGK